MFAKRLLALLALILCSSIVLVVAATSTPQAVRVQGYLSQIVSGSRVPANGAAQIDTYDGSGREKSAEIAADISPVLRRRRPPHNPPKIFVFGDSYSDNGNLVVYHPEFMGSELPPPYDLQRFSNGPIWVDYMAKALGTTLLPEVNGGTNYAVGGATISPENRYAYFPDADGFAQVERFLEREGSADPDAIYIVWLGINDLDPPREYVEWIFGTLVDMVGRLHAAGARKFVIPNLTDVGQLPVIQMFFPPEDIEAFSEMTVIWNDLLQGLDEIFPDAQIRISDVYRLKRIIDANPEVFGFTNTTDSCYQIFTDGSVCSNPDQYWFWDHIHPTSRAHKLLSRLFILDMLLAGELAPASAAP